MGRFGMMVLLTASLWCGAEEFKHEEKPENLKALFELLHKTIHATKDTKSAAALFATVLPDEARLKKALKDDVAPDILQKIVAMHKTMPAPDEQTMKTMTKPEQTSVEVFASTTEELAKYEKGSMAYKEFPGGAQRVAEVALRPGTKFHEVAVIEPGKTTGMKYHLFYWDEKSWSMLGPVWRVVK